VTYELDRSFASKGPVSFTNHDSHLQKPQALDLQSAPEGVDLGFFRATGIVMIVGTLLVGAVTLYLVFNLPVTTEHVLVGMSELDESPFEKNSCNVRAPDC
jgi:hypothetical protein